MQLEPYLSMLEENGIEIPTTVEEVLELKEQLLNDLIVEYGHASSHESYRTTPSTNYEIAIQRSHILYQYNCDDSELNTLMADIQRKEFYSCDKAVQDEWMEKSMEKMMEE